jgi:O-antigen/teichoic acid export membrane protein
MANALFFRNAFLRVRALLPSALYFTGVVGARGGNTVGLLLVATSLGFAGFAPVAATISFVTLFSAFIGSGLGTVALRNASVAYLRSAGEFRALVRWLAYCTLLTALGSVALAVLLAYPASRLSLGDGAFWRLFALAAASVFANHVAAVSSGILLASRRFRYLTIANMAFGALVLLACVVAVKWRSAELAVLGMGLAAMTQTAIGCWGIWRDFGRRRCLRTRPHAFSLRAIGPDWFAASTAGTILTAGQFLSLALLKDSPTGIGAIGLFSVMLQMVNIFLFVPTQISGYFFQTLVRYANSGQPAKTWRLTFLVAVCGGAFGLGSLALVYVAAPWIPIFRNVISYGPMQPIIAAFAITAGTLNAFLVSLYVASGQFRRWSIFIALGTSTNLLIVFILRKITPEAGLLGVTAGYCVTACCAITFIRIGQRTRHTKMTTFA